MTINRNFTLVGDKDAFYLVNGFDNNGSSKRIYGVGLYNSCLDISVIPNWFLMTRLSSANASISYSSSESLNSPLTGGSDAASRFIVPRQTPNQRLSNNSQAKPVVPDYYTGYSGLYNGNTLSPLEIPFSDTENYLRGSLKHVMYNGSPGAVNTTQMQLLDTSMYVKEGVTAQSTPYYGGLVFYLGELE